MYQQVLRWLTHWWLRLRLRFTKIKEHEQCPKCGHRLGRIRYEAEDDQIKHYCLVCQHAWGEPPIIANPEN